VQLFKVSPTPEAAYELCTHYAPDCDTAIGAADDNRDEEEEDEEEDEEEGEEEIDEDSFQINGTSDPLAVTHEYQQNVTYVRSCLSVFGDGIVLLLSLFSFSSIVFLSFFKNLRGSTRFE
jgi:hypothetical protein